MSRPLALASICLLAVLAYLPSLRLPFIADDFVQIRESRALGMPGGFAQLAKDPVQHVRISYFYFTYELDHRFGFNPAAFHIASLALHVLCCWLVYALGAWPLIGWRASWIAACFFAVYEGHQEAVMWPAASMELFVFLFGVASVAAFVHWLRGGSRLYYALACVALGAAMLSKESAYIFAALLALPLIEMRTRRWPAIIPFLAAAAAYVIWIAAGRSANLRFGDGSFSLSAPWPLVMAVSFWRLLFVWGLIALAVLLACRARQYRRLCAYAAAWMLLGLVPYGFLTYMTRVPSRHSYLASVGLALLVAAALVCLWDRFGYRLPLSAAAIILIVNVGILWGKKLDQFKVRALPTDLLVSAARWAEGPIHIQCYCYPRSVAEAAVAEAGGSVVWDSPAAPANPRCLEFSYTDVAGSVRRVFIPPSKLP